ncbi:MAG: hypothetical protein V1691_01320 [Chloroflexota bacterium]
MLSNWLSRLVEVSAAALTLAAICQEMEKPEEERQWHDKVAGLIPYDFRLPTVARLKEAYWNPVDGRLLTPEPFGIGWAINLYSLLEGLGIIEPSASSEEDFLMPTKEIKEILTQALETE